MKQSVVTFDLLGISTYSQSRYHEEPKKKSELPDDYDKRTAPSRTHLNEAGQLVIPRDSLVQCLAAAAQYSKKKIEGGRGATWTAKFKSGLSIMDDPIIQINGKTASLKSVTYFDGWMNADGVRGSGKRVMRRYPMIVAPYMAKVEVWIVDPIITEGVFVEIAEAAGMFIGLGRWRPQNGGQNGRFRLTNVQWQDNRDFETAISRKAA